MALTEVQLAKLIIEIDRLDTRADNLEKKALADDANFLSAAQTYGSELAGSSGTDYLYKEAKELREMLKFLKKVRSGATPLADFVSYKSRLETVDSQIKTLTKEKARLQLTLNQFELLHKLLSI